jgi:hypothetical protein
MPVRPWSLGLICLLGLFAEARAQTAADIAVQTTKDSLAATAGALEPPWMGGIGDLIDVGTGIKLVAKGDPLGAAEFGVNSATVKIEGKLGGPIAAGLTQAALDIGDQVIAPHLADALVAAFPGVFIPKQGIPSVPTNPFGAPPINTSTRTNTAAAMAATNSSNNVPPAPVATMVVAIPLRTASAPAPTSNPTQSPANAWLVALMTNPNNDLGARKIAAIALGINPDIITSNPVATKLLATVYGVSVLENWAAGSSTVTQGAEGSRTNSTGPSGNTTAVVENRSSGGSASHVTSNAGDRSASAPQVPNDQQVIKTIIPGRPAGNGAKVTVIRPQDPASAPSGVQTIIPGSKSNPSVGGLTANSKTVVALRAPSSSEASSSSLHGSTVAPAPIPNPVPASVAPAARITPGGISLNQAAAERLPLKLTLDGAYIKEGKIILSGKNNVQDGIDAALFLTALRAACENADPYFSLDADNIASWLAETNQAAEDLHTSLKQDFTWHFRARIKPNTPSVLSFRTISASQAYPQLWRSILTKYPNLRSRLVFRPEWLRQTRFGEILYTADVLLKELSGGATALGESKFRGVNIAGYHSATERTAAMDLLYQYSGWSHPDKIRGGGRIWYDLTETSDAVVARSEPIPSGDSEIRRLLERRGLLSASDEQLPLPTLTESDGAIDLSQVYPRMFVRTFDPVTHRDSSARFPGLNELAALANRTPQQYAAAYKEYENLVEVFRAYIVAVRAKQAQPQLCMRLPSQLLQSEKVASPLPEYHPTEYMLSVAWYEYADGRMRRAIGGQGGLFQGGVSLGVTRFLDAVAPSAIPTPIVAELKREATKPNENYAWRDDDGRNYVSLTLDDPAVDEREVSLQPSVPAQSAEPSVPSKVSSQPAISEKIGRFDLYDGAGIEGTQLDSMTLRHNYTSNSASAKIECAAACSGNSDCIGFDINQRKNLCTTYSSIVGTRAESAWTHGIWK